MRKIHDNVIEDDGVEEDPVGEVSVVKESGGKFLIRVKSNQESSAMVIRATKSGQKTITFKVVTNSVGWGFNQDPPQAIWLANHPPI